MKQDARWIQRKKRIFEIIEVGAPGDYVSRIYDFTSALLIVLNLGVILKNAHNFIEILLKTHSPIVYL